MNSSQFKKNQFKKLCSTLGCTTEEVKYIIGNLSDYYSEKIEIKVNKVTGEFKTYKDGSVKQRVITPSWRRLKEIQRAIKNKLLAAIPLPDNIHGGVKGRTNITNAKVHQGNKYQFVTDLQNFYPGISHEQVHTALLSVGFTNHYAYWITKLTTWKYQVPQGAPTSTHISNIVFLKTDQRLIEFCKDHGLTYTRYIDDLTFSAQYDFKKLLNDILLIVIDGGFQISYRKTEYKGDRTVTGIEIFNNYIDVPQKIKIKAAEEAVDSIEKPYLDYLRRVRQTNKNMKNKND